MEKMAVGFDFLSEIWGRRNGVYVDIIKKGAREMDCF
jgi:ribosomal protein L17